LLDEIASRQRGWIYLFNDALLTTTELEAGAMRKKFHVVRVSSSLPLL